MLKIIKLLVLCVTRTRLNVNLYITQVSTLSRVFFCCNLEEFIVPILSLVLVRETNMPHVHAMIILYGV